MDLDSAAGPGDAAFGNGGLEIDEQVHSWAELRDNGFSPDHGLTFANQRLDALRQIQIRPTPKSYDAQAIAAMNRVTLAKRAQDAASDQARYLHDDQLPARIGRSFPDRFKALSEQSGRPGADDQTDQGLPLGQPADAIAIR